MAVHQLVPSFKPGDAMGQAALHFQVLLRRLGQVGDLFADEVDPSCRARVRPFSALRPGPDDWVLYHHGIASPLAGRFLHLRCRRAVVFHNITPERFYQGTPLAEPLRAGRAQLAAMSKHAELGIGVSDFNCAELRAAGFETVKRVPLFVEPERFAATRADPALSARLGTAPALVAVSRVVPHKRFEDLLALHRELRRIRPEARLRIVGGYAEGDPSVRALLAEAKRVGQVDLLGRLCHSELVAAYRSAFAFVSMSEHEGFGVPLVEAMACDVPVVAYAAAAVPETLGGAGIAFTHKHFAALAELLEQVRTDAPLRRRLLDGQRRRLDDFSPGAAEEALAAALPLSPGSRTRAKAAAPRRPKVALVVQRFGAVTGGAEAHARQLAEHLAPHWDLTVLTTCAKDHLTWANAFAPGEDTAGPLRVRRFPTVRSRQMRAFNRFSRTLFGRANDRLAEELWLAEQGPDGPALLAHLAEQRSAYDGFVFFTYLYAPTAWGLPLVADRALLVPTAHDEPPFAFDVYSDAFERPAALMCNTPEEVELIARRWPHHARARVVGVGVDAPAKPDPLRFREKYGLPERYLFYVGRLEEGKGVGELVRQHRALARVRPAVPELVLAGAGDLRVGGAGVRALGRISDEDKFDGLAGAVAAVVPSRFESLSLLALEAFSVGTPLLANEASEVLRGQVARSGAGALYSDAASLGAALEQVQQDRGTLSRRAKAFARKHTWSKVVDAYREELARLMRKGKR